MITTVPVSDPAHPSHQTWLQILMTILNATIVIGPAVIKIVDPKDSEEAVQLGNLASTISGAVQGNSQ